MQYKLKTRREDGAVIQLLLSSAMRESLDYHLSDVKLRTLLGSPYNKCKTWMSSVHHSFVLREALIQVLSRRSECIIKASAFAISQNHRIVEVERDV